MPECSICGRAFEEGDDAYEHVERHIDVRNTTVKINDRTVLFYETCENSLDC